MKAGPIRRAAGTLGLLALIPTALMLIKGNVTLQVAAVRAGITLGTVMFLARVATWGVGWIADHWGWGGVFTTMVACCLLTIFFSALTLGHQAQSEGRLASGI